MNCRGADLVEDVEERTYELSDVDEVDTDVIGRSADGHSQLNKGYPTTDGLVGYFL